MLLSQKDYHEFLQTHLNLLYFIGYYTGIIDEEMEFKEFLETNISLKILCRNTFLNDKTILDEYFMEWKEIPDEQVSILSGFKKAITGQFVLLKCLSKHAILQNIENGNFYAVKALGETFEELIPDYPVILDLTILPFKGQIIYDGFILGGNVKIGKNIKELLHEEYMKAKKKNQIITTLD